MSYRFTRQKQDYADFAGGQVLYSLPGQPAFPVRLTSEIWQRCLAHKQPTGPYTIYDPCCGGAYHLTVLGYLHGQQITEIIVSDINTAVLSLAQRNLNLLTPSGLTQRVVELQQLSERYQKPSHAQALASARRLQAHLPLPTIPTRLFTADVTDGEAVKIGLKNYTPDIVFTDIPYGWLTTWHAEDEEKSPVWQMLESLRTLLSSDAIVAIAADKQQKVLHEGYERLEKFQVGKRRIWIGRPRYKSYKSE